jgi:uncharacterized protein (DUF1800 family)
VATVPGVYTKTPVPTAAERRMLSRMGTGYTRTQLASLRAAGSPTKWFEQQLAPSTVAEPAIMTTVDSWYADRKQTAAVKWQKKEAGTKPLWQWARDLSCWTMLRRIYSKRTVLETMVDFWSGHLHIPANHTFSWPWRYDYDILLRKHALGRFDDMLVAASLHPAMLLYLDNFRSEFGNPNENQGRELLELHTVGREAGYTEAMVKSSSLILSGWTVDYAHTFEPSYNISKHTTGPVTVLGFSEANAAADGRDLTVRYLRYLAHHPATARRIATKLATRFVSANPSPAYVDRLAKAFLAAGTDIKATLRWIIASPEFTSSSELMVRSGPEDTIATIRALGIVATGTRPLSLAQLLPTLCGEFIYTWPRPDGPPRTTESFCTPGRMLCSANTHWQLARGDSIIDATFKPTTSWLPETSMRFDAYVDHLCRTLLGRTSTADLLNACVLATGVSPAAKITKTHMVATWRFVSVAAALLDSPQHMSR